MIKKIPDYEGYFIEDTGKVYCNLGRGCRRDIMSCRTVQPYEIKPRLTQHGYARVCMRNPRTNKRDDKYIHRLVAESFIPNPEHKKYVNHKNYIRDCNTVDNLEWNTAKENTDYTMSSNHLIRDCSGRYSSNYNTDSITKIV